MKRHPIDFGDYYAGDPSWSEPESRLKRLGQVIATAICIVVGLAILSLAGCR